MGNGELTRRTFLSSAALVSAGAVIGLTGCSAGSEPTNATTAAADEAPAWDREVEVLVVGSGMGLAAAVSAKEAGADVLVIEKADHAGGLTLASAGNCTMGGNNIVQQEEGIEDDNEDWYECEMKVCGHRAVPEIIRMLVDNGADTVSWMADMGMVWEPNGKGAVGGIADRGLRPGQNPDVYAGGTGTPQSGICWTQVWEHKLNEQGVEILLEHKMTNLYREGDGPVIGAEVETPDGTINIKASKGVILCTGSWTDNARMAEAWDPRLVGEDTYGDGGIPADNLLFNDSAGDGHIAAVSLGASYADMSYVSYMYLFYGSRSYWTWGEPPFDWTNNDNWSTKGGLANMKDENLWRSVILVNGEGKRYVNELTGAESFPKEKGSITERPECDYNDAYLALSQPRNVWMIADSTIAAALEWPLDEIENPNPYTGRMFDPACVAVADTIEDLASKMGIPADALASTIAAYNGYAEVGEDPDFGKSGGFPKVETGPFYGLKASLIRHTNRNGIRVNTKSQVIDSGVKAEDTLVPVSIDNEPIIPHLYAAGELGDIMGWRRVHNTLGHFTTAARMAGANAAVETAV